MIRAGWDGCVALTAVLVGIPEEERLDALALFFDASIKTAWFTKEPWRVQVTPQ